MSAAAPTPMSSSPPRASQPTLGAPVFGSVGVGDRSIGKIGLTSVPTGICRATGAVEQTPCPSVTV